jgi:probable phosphoglycerate mutase
MWNAVGRWQGQADPPLSPLGETQAAEAADRLADVGFSAVVSSDLRRARATADILARPLGLPVVVDPDLREIDVGDWTGLTRAEIETQWPGELAEWSEGRSESPLGGESRTALAERARAAMARAAAAAQPGDHLLVVTHGALIRNLDRTLGLPPQPMPNLSGRWYEVDGGGGVHAGVVVSLADPEERTLSPSP